MNVDFEDIYKQKNVQTAVGGGGTLMLKDYRCYSLLQHFMWPEGKAARMTDLRGEGSFQWDYIVLCEDPYVMANFPGLFAEAVKLIQDEVAQSASPAQIVLLAQWPENSSGFSAADFNEIVYRVGDSAGLTVVPAGKAWASYTGQDSDTAHPTPRGEYLAVAAIYSQLFDRNSDTTDALAVTLVSNDTSEATVLSGNIPAGQASADFAITAVDDALADGTQTVTITASASGHSNGNDTLDVTGDEAPVTYTVSYDGNGQTSGAAPSDQTKTAGLDLTLAMNSGNLAKTGFTFAGWNTASDGTGTDYPVGATYSNDKNLNLFIKWNPLSSSGVITPVSASSSSTVGSPRTIDKVIDGSGLTEISDPSTGLDDSHAYDTSAYWLSASDAVTVGETLTFDLGGTTMWIKSTTGPTSAGATEISERSISLSRPMEAAASVFLSQPHRSTCRTGLSGAAIVILPLRGRQRSTPCQESPISASLIYKTTATTSISHFTKFDSARRQEAAAPLPPGFPATRSAARPPSPTTSTRTVCLMASKVTSAPIRANPTPACFPVQSIQVKPPSPSPTRSTTVPPATSAPPTVGQRI